MFVKTNSLYLNLAEVASFVPGVGVTLRSGKLLELESAGEEKALALALELYGCADLSFINANYPVFRQAVARIDLERVLQMEEANARFREFLQARQNNPVPGPIAREPQARERAPEFGLTPELRNKPGVQPDPYEEL